MSKDKEKNVDDEMQAPPLTPKKRKSKKGLIFLIFILLAAVLIFLFRKPIQNIVRNIPVIGKLMPQSSEGEESLSKEELEARVASEEKEIADLKSQIETLQNSNQALTAKNDSLKQYETNYNDFVKQKEEWDTQVAKTNSDLFIKQFESVYPDAAERIYATLKGEKVLSDQEKALSATIGSMDEEKAAAALEELLKTDPELIKIIMDGMAKDSKAAVLSEMDSESAAQVIKLIAPDQNITQ